jgi:hypothetical protein
MSTPEIRGLQGRITALEAKVEGQSEPKLIDLSEKVITGALDVNQHFDDKASRILSAMAFLTAAAAAIFTKAYSPSPPTDLIRRKIYEALPATAGLDVTNAINKVSWEVPHASVGGIEWSLVSFSLYMLFVLVGAVLYLTALGPFLNISQAWRSEIRPDRSSDKSLKLSSLAFFYFISEVGEEEWKEYWKPPVRTPAQLQDELTDNYIKEARKVAQNAKVKYTYLSVGSLFFIVAIFFLMALIAGLLSTDNRVVGFFTMVGGIVWATTLAGVSKVRPPRETKTHWAWAGVAIALTVIAIILGIGIWFK